MHILHNLNLNVKREKEKKRKHIYLIIIPYVKGSKILTKTTRFYKAV